MSIFGIYGIGILVKNPSIWKWYSKMEMTRIHLSANSSIGKYPFEQDANLN
jgi:hypothetical protein